MNTRDIPCLMLLLCAPAAACSDDATADESTGMSASTAASDPGGSLASDESGPSSDPDTSSTSVSPGSSTGLDVPTGTDSSTSTSTSSSTSTSTGPDNLSSTDTSDTGGEADSGTTTAPPPPDMGPPADDPNLDIPPLDAEGCPGLYAQDLLPTFELTIDPAVWQALQTEWANGQLNEDMGLDPTPNHPLAEFRYGEVVIDDAEIRLRGNPTWWTPEDKLQFQIEFDEHDKDGRFLGLRKLALDAATFNRHMLRDRLALAIMRDMGITAPCANNARLDINGEYYGLFTSLEKLDMTFLERNFADPTGNLYERANWELKTNKDTATGTRLAALKAAKSSDALEDYLDLEQALQVFAAEAILPDSDGMWAGGLNFYIYDDPLGGNFVLLPWDLDNTFERFDDPPEGEYPANPDPVVWEKPTSHGRPIFTVALQDPEWFAYYLERIEQQVESSYQPEDLHQRIDDWTAQIKESVFEDPNKPYSNNHYLNRVAALHAYVDARADFLDDWLDCWQEGGTADVLGYCIPLP
jgi:hypothetical protein